MKPVRAVSREEIVDRAGRLRERVRSLGGTKVQILAVTKGFDAQVIETAAECGFMSIGESYAQELEAKWSQLGESLQSELSVHFIGKMQTNKVRKIERIVGTWQTVDRVSLIEELSKRAGGADVMLQINIAGNDSQGGCEFSEASELVSFVRDKGLNPVGAMAIGPQGDPADIRVAYKKLVDFADDHELPERSIGMTNDLEIAIEAGSTMVRIGTALFGDRPQR